MEMDERKKCYVGLAEKEYREKDGGGEAGGKN